MIFRIHTGEWRPSFGKVAFYGQSGGGWCNGDQATPYDTRPATPAHGPPTI